MRALGIVALILGLNVSVRALDVPITVEDPISAERACEVVSGGIPMPEGRYKDAAAFRLLDGEAEVPVQVSPIVKYPDGSLHWVLVSFPVKLAPNEKRTYALKEGPSKAVPANPVEVSEDGSRIKVSNGLVSFTIDRENFNGFETVSYAGKDVFRAAKAGLTANGKGGPGKLIHLSYPYRGPVRTTLYLKGTYGKETAPTWALEVTLCAGEPRIRIEHHLRNGGVNAPKKLLVSGPALRLGLAGEMRATESGTAPGGRANLPAWGWQAFGGIADVLVFMRHGGPKTKGIYRAAIEGEELAVDLSGSGGEITLEFASHKSTEIDIVFGKSCGVEALSEPLHARAACAWYAAHDSMGIGRFFGSLDDETETYKAWGWKGAGDPKKIQSVKPDPALYRYSLGDAHFESECDHLRGLVFAYIRSGQRGFLDEAHAWARAWKAYLGYRSNEYVYGKDGRYSGLKWGTSRMCATGCHFYMAGLFNYALLTGSVDALEAAFDGAEFANAGYGEYSKTKPGMIFGQWGTRDFARFYVVVARAYDVARTDEWKKALVHYARVALETPDRDPRGFTSQGNPPHGTSAVERARGRAEKFGPGAIELFQKEKVKTDGKVLKHPKYGTWVPKEAATWPEPIESWANYVAYEALSSSPDPQDKLLAEDLMDYAIAQAHFGARYAFHPVQKAVYYKMHIDFPIPDFIAAWCGGDWDQYKPKGTDSWYTKWWPNTLAIGYRLTGDPALLEKCKDVLWWGLNRDYIKEPYGPEGEAPRYSRIELSNTKGDVVSPVCLAFGLVPYARKDTQAPAAINDVAAVALGGGRVELSWTAPGDEGAGSAARYQVKWAEKPLVDYLEPGDEYRAHFRDGQLDVAYWNMAANVVGEPTPQARGTKEKMVISLPVGKKLYLAVRTFDDSHNRSAMSNVVAVDNL